MEPQKVISMLSMVQSLNGTNLTAIECIRELQDENAALKARLDKAVELPFSVGAHVFVSPNHGKSFHKAILYGKNENGIYLVQLCDNLLTEDEKQIVENPMSRIFYDWFAKLYTEAEAQAKLDEMKGGAE